MDEPLSQPALRAAVLTGSALYTGLDVVAQTGSTNADLAAAAAAGAPAGTVLAAERQTAGRGRLDRGWQAGPGTALTFSVLLRPAGVPPAMLGWLPLLAGVAVVSAVASAVPAARLKWPNDVIVPAGPGAGKLAGILAEQAGGAVVVGVGLNVSTTAARLPPGGTSLALAGAAPGREQVLAAVLAQLERWYLRWAGGGAGSWAPGDAAACGLAAEYLRWCATAGSQVRVQLPAGPALEGRATGVDETGRLLVRAAGGTRAVSAGDVVHVR